MQNQVLFSFPGFYQHFPLAQALVDLQQNHPEYFNDNFILDTLYDSFPCIWNGGRYLSGITDLNNVRKTLEVFRNKIGLRMTFTNALLEPNHLNDTFCNQVLEELAKEPIKVGITLNSELLKDYIETNYPNCFYYNWSATKCLSDITEINQKSKNELVIPSYQDLNNQFDKLQLLTSKNNIELIVDEGCNENCPYRASHYLSFNKVQLFLEDTWERCHWDNGDYFYGRKTGRSHNIDVNMITTQYVPLGFMKFKVAGREDVDINLIESFVYYLIRPEYQNQVRNQLLMFVYHNATH